MSVETSTAAPAEAPSLVELKAKPNLGTIEEDCKAIYKAIKGLGTDEDALIRVICHRDHDTIMAIRDLYYNKYRRDLAKHIADDTSFNLKAMLVGLTTPHVEYLARELQWAMKGMGTAEGAIIDCIAFITDEQLAAVKEEFLGRFDRSLEEAISSDTSGNFRRLCLELLMCNRDKTAVANADEAMHVVEALYKAGEGRWGTDNTYFIDVFTKTSRAQLAEIDQQYMAKYNRSLRQVVGKETSGPFARGLKAMVMSKAEWWVKRFNKGIRGLGTDDNIVVRGLVLNSHEELAIINNMYYHEFHTTLAEAIRGDTSGYYRKACLARLDP